MCKILAVDDNLVTLDYYKELTKKINHDITIADHGKNALKLLNTNGFNKYDVILLDMEMPVMDGLETLKAIRKINKNIPIIMVTAYANQKKIKKAFNLGANDVYIKPFTMNRLQSIIEKINLNTKFKDVVVG